MQRLESDDRVGKARLVCHRSVRSSRATIVAGQNLFMHQRPGTLAVQVKARMNVDRGRMVSFGRTISAHRVTGGAVTGAI